LTCTINYIIIKV